MIPERYRRIREGNTETANKNTYYEIIIHMDIIGSVCAYAKGATTQKRRNAKAPQRKSAGTQRRHNAKAP